uniref:C2H2-type domain-containing protein n=1 Tax=Panagrolaimus sp. ES5 TaxID=591445 RepID=A0AC34GSE3_9BILA
MFLSTQSLAGLGMVAAAMAAANAEKLKSSLENSSNNSFLNEQLSRSSPIEVMTPKSELLQEDHHHHGRKSGKAEKVMHSCPHCNFTTVMSQHMKSHLEAHERHQGQMYQCDICQMQFSQKANMHRHRMRHSGVKPYECRFCFKKFFRKDQMQEHSMTHIKTGDDFDCPVAGCPQQFSQHSALRSHLEDQHIISATQQASCKRCSLLFSNSRRLLLHYQTKHDEADASLKRSFKEEADAFTSLANLDLNAAMQLLTGNSNNGNITSPLNEKPPPAKKRRTNNNNNTNKRAVANQLSAPMSLSASPQTLSTTTTPPPNTTSSLLTAAAKGITTPVFTSIASFTENFLPLDMSKRALSNDESTRIESPFQHSNAVSVVQSPKKSHSPDIENDDVVVDVCGTTEFEKEIKSEPSSNSPKLPKAESPDYERVIANGYKFGMRPEFLPLMNGVFNPFFLTSKPDQLLWNQNSNVSTTITSSLPSSLISNSNNNGNEEVSTSTTHSPSDRSSTGSIDKEPLECGHCGIVFNDRTLHLLHKGLHSAQDPWKCNLCGAMCYDKYVFTSHMISSDHA